MLKKIAVGLATLGAMAAGAYALFIRPCQGMRGSPIQRWSPPTPSRSRHGRLMIDPKDPRPDAYFDGSWVFVLKELDERTTRVIERMRADYQPRLWLAPLVYLLLEPVTFVMERKMLLGIKQRVEGVNRQRKVYHDLREASS